MRKLAIGAAAAFLFFGGQAVASEGAALPTQHWSFDGPFGTFDRGALQRGLQVYKEVCSGCHSLNLIYYRNLTDLGYSAEQVKAFAAEYEVTDGPNDEGEMFQRPAKPSDKFVKPFPNEQAARASNNGALPPDLSLITEARKGGPDYLHAVLTGYHAAPTPEFLKAYEEALRQKGEEVKPFKMNTGMHFNDYFPGNQIAMPPPLSDGQVEYADGTKATVDQMARDVVQFLTWAAEPNMEHRKQMGIKVMLFLVVFTGLTIAVKKKIWADVH